MGRIVFLSPFVKTEISGGIKTAYRHAELLTEMSGFAPVLLLDEVVAHLDPGRRAALYHELERLGAQVFMTGADPSAGSIT